MLQLQRQIAHDVVRHSRLWLRKEGSSIFSAPNGVNALADTTSRFILGSIEKSNVNSVMEMTRMIEVTRAYTSVASMRSQQSDFITYGG